MISKRLVDWIKRGGTKGYTAKQLESLLLDRGHSVGDAREAVSIASSLNMLKSSSIFSPLVIGGIIFLVLLGSVILILAFRMQDSGGDVIHVNAQSNHSLVDEEGNEWGEVDIKIEGDIEFISDCGGFECFNENFFECSPSTISIKPQFLEAKYFYEILGVKDGYCEVRSKFIENPNPDWVDKEMVCLYDYSLDFETAVQDMERCEGELYDLMMGR